ncbi:M56 family metallopeptidase [Streptomyces lonegramiae]|uniref:M56 family metallopeptidase n=1 Tax=Streptomyces lonegramiae TaxID=3075524 RepID=A0ABU2X5T6_9ACTN|nr:M56 family metallopeptidase [Streptomyces sp. DSM 41529]MDT0541269.1 M56 family metallopeptidase [Streptomyces sp. DSM 41529]
MTGHRAFWTLVAISATIRAAVACLGCCLAMAPAWRITHHGVGPGLLSSAVWAGAVLLILSVAGAVRSVQRVRRGLVATRAVGRHVRAAAVDDAAVRAAARQVDPTVPVDVVEDVGRFAFAYGLLRPRVAVSSGLVESATSEELRAVLVHEAEHVRGRDPLRALVAGFLTAQHFALPLLGHLRAAVVADRELAADRCAMARCGAGAVAGALLKVGDAPRWAHAAPAAAMGGRALLAARITQLEGDPPPPPRPDRRQVAVTAAGAALYAWAIAGSAWLIAATPLICLGRGH